MYGPTRLYYAGIFSFLVSFKHMQAATLVSLDEYLHTSYDPDCDFVEGALEERNSGEHLHARLQTLLAIHLHLQGKSTGVRVVVEQRVQTGPARFRVPDLGVTDGNPGEPVLTHPPLLASRSFPPKTVFSKPADVRRST